MMHKPESLTIKELPKRKKMMIDEKNPIRKIRQDKFAADEEERLNEIGSLYGSAMAMMIRYERGILGQPERLPGLRSSFMLLESNMGRLNTFDFEDVMGKDKSILKNNAHDAYLAQFD